MPGDRLDHARLNLADRPCIPSRCLDQFRRDDPLGFTSEQCRARPEVQLLPARAVVLKPVTLVRDIRE